MNHCRIHPQRLSVLLVFFVTMLVTGAMPGQAHALSSGVGDKTLHLLTYGVMSLLCFRALRGSRWFQSLASLLIIAVLGFLDEWIQSSLPYRNASLIDWCFDMAAALIVIVFLNLHASGTLRPS